MAYGYPAYGNYNPINPFGPVQNYPTMQQPPQTPTQPIQPQGAVSAQTGFYCRPVASKEEALGVPVDFMGHPMFFPDLAHNVIYVKRFNATTGAADVYEFRGPDSQNQTNPAIAFAPLDELIDLKETIEQIKADVDRLKKPTNRTVKKNDADE